MKETISALKMKVVRLMAERQETANIIMKQAIEIERLKQLEENE